MPLRSALIVVDTDKTAPLIVANAATMAVLETQEITSQPKASIFSKMKAAASKLGQDASFYFTRAQGVIACSSYGTLRTALASWFTAEALNIATLTAVPDAISSDGQRSAFVLTTGTASPTPATGLSVEKQALDDLVSPHRSSVSLDQLINKAADIFGEELAVEINQLTGIVRIGQIAAGDASLETVVTTQETANPNVKPETIVLDVTEETAPVSPTDSVAQLLG